MAVEILSVGLIVTHKTWGLGNIGGLAILLTAGLPVWGQSRRQKTKRRRDQDRRNKTTKR